MANLPQIPGQFDSVPDPTDPLPDMPSTSSEAPENCPCQGPCKVKCDFGSICETCDKPHRFDYGRNNAYSTFTCTWCGSHVVNMERDIRQHLHLCTRKPHPRNIVDPRIIVEDDMCNCIIYCHCGLTPCFMDTYTVSFKDTRRTINTAHGAKSA